MRKLLILIAINATLFVTGCTRDPIVDRLPWVHRIEIQQGNVINQDDVNQLKAGIDKRQVLFLLGTPMIADPFHANRWDYMYKYDPGSGEGKEAQKHITLYFEDEKLTRITGELQPDVLSDDEPVRKQSTVTVPPQIRSDQGILTRLWHWLSFDK